MCPACHKQSSPIPQSSRRAGDWRVELFACSVTLGLLGGKVAWEYRGLEPEPPSPRIGWAENVTVLAAASQAASARYDVNYCSYFSRALAAQLARPEIRSLEDAACALRGAGYDAPCILSFRRRQFPSQTARPIQGWRKDDAEAVRYAALFADRDVHYALTVNNFQSIGQALTSPSIFDVPTNHVYEVHRASRANLDQWAQRLRREAERQPAKRIEALIYLVSHGDTRGSVGSCEGDKVGSLGRLADEPGLKTLLNLPPQVNVVVIIEACYGGAFTADYRPLRVPPIRG